MKKKYIKPIIGKELMEASLLTTASVNNLNQTEADANWSGNAVNFSREGSFWDDAE